MGAPPQELIDGMRNGTFGRHLFFSLAHTEGTIYVHDGVGDFLFEGQVYNGIYGLASIEGVSNSRDIQNSAILFTLNKVPLDAVRNTNLSVKRRAVTLKAAWLDESGAVRFSKTLFQGLGNTIASEPRDDTVSIQFTARNKLASWTNAPRRYYTDADQQALYAGDTGMKYMADMENLLTLGWSKDVETTGGFLDAVFAGGGTYALRSSLGGAVGDHTNGVGAVARTYSGIWRLTRAVSVSESVLYEEDGTGAANEIVFTAGVGRVQFGGAPSYIDITGDVRTGSGALVQYNDVLNKHLRKAGDIPTDGAATAEFLTSVTVSAVDFIRLSSGTFSNSIENWTAAVFDSINGAIAANVSGDIRHKTSAGGNSAYRYVEAGTLTPAVFTGGRVKVGGVDCVKSANGAIITASGARLVRDDSPTAFLRVWT